MTRKKDCYLSGQFKRLAARRGVKRAVMAVVHTMLIYHKFGENCLERINKDQLPRY